ncbi:Hypothetical protein SMAX5B_004567 [Scophthalmus maximus]|uniref:Uncharacterized protein n=1 Tax=Scophthalmus maximus TaxID=52904 RepID=A0A2U9B4H6_SCOMX|nr:Hypothetical protein SMAX5B_004567 [Scophthalmus maximus]
MDREKNGGTVPGAHRRIPGEASPEPPVEQQPEARSTRLDSTSMCQEAAAAALTARYQGTRRYCKHPRLGPSPRTVPPGPSPRGLLSPRASRLGPSPRAPDRPPAPRTVVPPRPGPSPRASDRRVNPSCLHEPTWRTASRKKIAFFNSSQEVEANRGCAHFSPNCSW